MAIIRLEEQTGYKDWLKNTNNSWQYDASIQATTDENPFIYLTNTGEDDAVFQIALSKLINNIQLITEDSILVFASIFDRIKGIKVELRDQAQNILTASNPLKGSKTWIRQILSLERIPSGIEELWITFILPSGASTVISEICGQITIQPRIEEVLENTSTVRVVNDAETIQQVLDRIENASERNKYLILVPPGHENEYFNWKPNVEIRFLDNLEEKWQLDELEGWDDLDNWDIGSAFNATIENIRGEKTLKLTTIDSSGSVNNYFLLVNKDLRKYQGLLLTIKFKNKTTSQSIVFPFFTYDSNGSFIQNSYGFNSGIGRHERIVFFPFNFDTQNLANVDGEFQWDSVEKFYIPIYHTENGDEVLISNLKLVRTFPYPCVFLRTDDSYLGNNGNRVKVLHELEKKHLPVIWAIITNEIVWDFNGSFDYPTPELLQEFQSRSYVSIVNHTHTHPDFVSLQDNEQDTLFELEASRYIFERIGLKDALRWFVNPYGNTNAHLQRYLRQFGYMSVYNYYNEVPLCVSIPNHFLNQTYSLKKGGIATYLFHDFNLNTDEAMQALLDEINTILQTHRPVSIRDIERLMNNSHEKFSPRQTKPTLYKVLDSDFDMYFYHKQLFLDPNGTDRNINVRLYKLRAGDTFLIVNVGTSGNLIFDPSGANITISPSSSIKVVYTGEGWMQI